MLNKQRIIITPGEPSGIGFDLTIKIAQYNWPVELVVCCSKLELYNRSIKIGLPLKIIDYVSKNKPIPQKSGTLNIIDIATKKKVIPGKLCIDNSSYVIQTLIRACNGCINKEFDAMVTGPVHKGIINDAGFKFTGHTEFLAKHASVNKVVMMFQQTEKLRIALATTHIPIKKVSQLITYQNLKKIINVIYFDLKNKFRILNPNILVCGLNPHAGENGYIGTEEITIISPVINELRKTGINIIGPLPADTIFQSKYFNKADVILSMYHDQLLPILKCNKNKSVNISLGLPFIRTSVDHGTALELAGLNYANKNSFMNAINLAIEIILKKNE